MLVDPAYASICNAWILQPDWLRYYAEALRFHAERPNGIKVSNLPFADGTDWPECSRTKGVYLIQGGTVILTAEGLCIVKPPWVQVHTLGTQKWDWCTLCKKYCVYNHVVSRRHWEALIRHPVLCVPCAVPKPIEDQTSDDEEGQWF